MKSVLIGLMFMILCTSGCAVVSKDLRIQADPDLSFEQVSANPAQYAGEIVIWGGYIIENQAGQEESRLIILQAPLTSQQKPKSKDASAGRFIARQNTFLDPEIYSKHRGVTVAGKVTGKTKILENDPYGPYPVIQIKEIHLWQDPDDDRYKPWGPAYRPYGPWWYGPPSFYSPRPSFYWHSW
ncbi:MAG: Slp family lipoprotein [Desulfovermiculus sp.]